ncbi:MAG: RagB/SusD family nutrient uptake outer membrane protein [Cyclobacteriaceae bacterium]|nr:RagB/SusD family nutrient uptake outer membrane protein [Cyclobacteriaceae bacterium]
MKNIIKYTAMSVLTLFAVGCGDEFLEKEPSQFLTSDQFTDAAALNPEVIAGTMTGIYALMFETGTGGLGNHVDFGQKAYDIELDMLSGNMALSVNTYGWYRDVTQLTLMNDFTSTFLHYKPWRYYYRIIRSANMVIDGLGGNEAIPELDDNKYIMGQAKTMRAHSYFYLTQLFTYEYDAAQEILPIYTNSIDPNPPKSPASDVFELIVNDLEEAIDLMDGYVRPSKTQVDANIAKVILAYALAFRAQGNDLQRAKDLTNEVINTAGYPLTTAEQLAFPGAGSGFNNVNTPSWMWGMDLTSDQGLNLVSWWGQIDYYTYSYAAFGDVKAIDRALYDQIPADDIRKTQFNPGAGNFALIPYNKFFDPARIAGNQRFILTDYLYMRIDEVYLLNAEVAARSGDEGTARTRLKELLTARIPDVSYIDGLSGNGLAQEIYLQNRIELWGEGKTYLAMKRNKYDMVRGSNWLFSPNITLPYNDPRLTYSIPQNEIQNNPFITEGNK